MARFCFMYVEGSASPLIWAFFMELFGLRYYYFFLDEVVLISVGCIV